MGKTAHPKTPADESLELRQRVGFLWEIHCSKRSLALRKLEGAIATNTGPKSRKKRSRRTRTGALGAPVRKSQGNKSAALHYSVSQIDVNNHRRCIPI
ncbi:MAG: hypothetical protein F6J93_29935 [Oscillatoria sp. SIO1A7]|nr:hypothetical protein [Oscillatoria sp. SIO1A7]